MNKLRPLVLGLGFPLLVFLVWYLASEGLLIPAHILPSPRVILEYLLGALVDKSLFPHLQLTLFRVVVGFSLGYFFGVLIALLTSLITPIREVLDPTIQGIRAIPPLAWIPLFIIWLGIGEESKVFLIALTSFFPVYLNVCAGFQGVDRKIIELSKVLGHSPAETIQAVYFPSISPNLWTAARSGLGLAWMVVVAAELLGASKGLGFLLQFGRNVARPEISLACLILFALLGKLSDSILATLEQINLKWRDTIHA